MSSDNYERLKYKPVKKFLSLKAGGRTSIEEDYDSGNYIWVLIKSVVLVVSWFVGFAIFTVVFFNIIVPLFSIILNPSFVYRVNIFTYDSIEIHVNHPDTLFINELTMLPNEITFTFNDKILDVSSDAEAIAFNHNSGVVKISDLSWFSLYNISLGSDRIKWKKEKQSKRR